MKSFFFDQTAAKEQQMILQQQTNNIKKARELVTQKYNGYHDPITLLAKEADDLATANGWAADRSMKYLRTKIPQAFTEETANTKSQLKPEFKQIPGLLESESKFLMDVNSHSDRINDFASQIRASSTIEQADNLYAKLEQFHIQNISKLKVAFDKIPLEMERKIKAKLGAQNQNNQLIQEGDDDYEDVEDNNNEMQQLMAELKKVKEEMKAQKNIIKNQEKTIKDQADALKNKDDTIKDKDDTIKDKDNSINKLKQEKQDANKTIDQQKKTISKQQDDLIDKDFSIVEKDATIDELTQDNNKIKTEYGQFRQKALIKVTDLNKKLKKETEDKVKLKQQIDEFNHQQQAHQEEVDSLFNLNQSIHSQIQNNQQNLSSMSFPIIDQSIQVQNNNVQQVSNSFLEINSLLEVVQPQQQQIQLGGNVNQLADNSSFQDI